MSPSPEQLEETQGLDELLKLNSDLEERIMARLRKLGPNYGDRPIGFIFDRDEERVLYIHPIYSNVEDSRKPKTRVPMVTLGGKGFLKQYQLLRNSYSDNSESIDVYWSYEGVKDYPLSDKKFPVSLNAADEIVLSSRSDSLQDEGNEGVVFLDNKSQGFIDQLIGPQIQAGRRVFLEKFREGLRNAGLVI